MRNYKTWYWTAVVLQFLAAAMHSLSFLNDPQPSDDNERTMLELMRYERDTGGMMVSMWDLFIGLSACFTLLYFFGGLINAYLLRRNADDALLNGILWINLLVFGAGFAIMAAFTFPPPIVVTGLVFLFLGLALLTKKLSVNSV